MTNNLTKLEQETKELEEMLEKKRKELEKEREKHIRKIIICPQNEVEKYNSGDIILTYHPSGIGLALNIHIGLHRLLKDGIFKEDEDVLVTFQETINEKMIFKELYQTFEKIAAKD